MSDYFDDAYGFNTLSLYTTATLQRTTKTASKPRT